MKLNRKPRAAKRAVTAEGRKIIKQKAVAKKAQIKADMKRSIFYGSHANEYVMSKAEKRELDEIRTTFSHNMEEYHITQIQRIYNPYLERKYEATRERFQKENRGVTENLTFHGTEYKNIDK